MPHGFILYTLQLLDNRSTSYFLVVLLLTKPTWINLMKLVETFVILSSSSLRL